MASNNLQVEKQLEPEAEEVKSKLEQIKKAVKENVSKQLKIEKLDTDFANEERHYQMLVKEIEAASLKWQDDEEIKKLDAKLNERRAYKIGLEKSIEDIKESIHKLQPLVRTKANRIKCLEKRAVALEKQANSLNYTKHQLMQRIRRSAGNP